MSFRVDLIDIICSSTFQTRASLLAHYKNSHVSQNLETADTVPCADDDDVNANLKEDFRKLKNNFERLNTIIGNWKQTSSLFKEGFKFFF